MIEVEKNTLKFSLGVRFCCCYENFLCADIFEQKIIFEQFQGLSNGKRTFFTADFIGKRTFLACIFVGKRTFQ